MRKIRIYLGDLTHETITISSDTMPLNVGFLAAYLKKFYENEIEIELFKSPKELFDKKTALLSSLLLSTSMIQLVYSQELKQYAMFAFFTLLSVYFFIRLPNKHVITLTVLFYK